MKPTIKGVSQTPFNTVRIHVRNDLALICLLLNWIGLLEDIQLGLKMFVSHPQGGHMGSLRVSAERRSSPASNGSAADAG